MLVLVHPKTWKICVIYFLVLNELCNSDFTCFSVYGCDMRISNKNLLNWKQSWNQSHLVLFLFETVPKNGKLYEVEGNKRKHITIFFFVSSSSSSCISSIWGTTRILCQAIAEIVFIKRQKYDVGKNILLNRFWELNNLIVKHWLLLSLDSFKINVKIYF